LITAESKEKLQQLVPKDGDIPKGTKGLYDVAHRIDRSLNDQLLNETIDNPISFLTLERKSKKRNLDDIDTLI